MSTLAVLSDIHGNLPALQAVVADMQQRAITTVVNLGDHASGPLWPYETLEFLIGQPWLQIAGNHDRQLVQQHPDEHGASDRYAFEHISPAQKAWLQALPALAELPQDILLCHGTPASDSRYLLETVEHGRVRLASRAEIRDRLGGATASLLLCGHSHLARAVRLSSGMLLVNPGSVGVPAYTDTEPELHIVEVGSPHARYALLEQGSQGWRVEFVAVAYDHQAAARQAERNGRADWEVALRTGYTAILPQG